MTKNGTVATIRSKRHFGKLNFLKLEFMVSSDGKKVDKDGWWLDSKILRLATIEEALIQTLRSLDEVKRFSSLQF